MKVGAIILCRYSSSRLPGKILKEIKGKTILQYIHERIEQSKNVNEIIIATSEEHSDDPIERFCIDQNYTCFRGSLGDVSRRFLEAASYYNLDYAIRINGDNLFCDAGLIDEAIGCAISEKLDFVSNVPGRTYPIGMSVEVVRTEFYEKLISKFSEEKYKEHVTLYMYEKEESFNFKFLKNEVFPEAAGLHLAIDTKSDFEMALEIMDKLSSDHRAYNWIKISKFLLNEKYLEG